MRIKNQLHSVLIISLSFTGIVTNVSATAVDVEEGLLSRRPKQSSGCLGFGDNNAEKFKRDMKELSHAFENFATLSVADQNDLLHRYQPMVQKWDIEVELSSALFNSIPASKATRTKFKTIVKIYQDNKVSLRAPKQSCALV
jgi:hypothetical protein